MQTSFIAKPGPKRRAPNHVYALYAAYCQFILGRAPNPQLDGYLMKRAGDAVRGAESLGYEPQDKVAQGVLGILLAIQSGKTEFTHYEEYAKFSARYRYPTPISFDVLFYHPVLENGQKRSDVTIMQAYLEVPEQPPVYDRRAYAEWVVRWGRKALKQGQWDAYAYPLDCQPEEDVLPPAQLLQLFGPQVMEKSLAKWANERTLRKL